MKSSDFNCLAVIGFILANIGFCSPVKGMPFSEKELDPNSIIAIARPYGTGNYDLLVIEQLRNRQRCWQENGSNPVIVDPLLLHFDFTGSCQRSTDSNGYSLRINGEDLGLDYLFRIVERNGELFLVGTARRDHSLPELIVGRTYGIKPGLLKIILDPKWRLTQREYNGVILSHFYFTTQDPLVSIHSGTQMEQSPPLSTIDSQPKVVKEWTFTAATAHNDPPQEQKVRNFPDQTNNSSVNSYFRVIALIKDRKDQEKIKKIYPDGISTSYQGLSAIQIGRFGNRSNAESILETLNNAGLEGRIVQ